MKSFWKKEAATLFVLLLTILICGCVVATKATVIAPEIISMFEGTYKVDPYMEKNRPLTVAVLPSGISPRANRGSNPYAGVFTTTSAPFPSKTWRSRRSTTCWQRRI